MSTKKLRSLRILQKGNFKFCHLKCILQNVEMILHILISILMALYYGEVYSLWLYIDLDTHRYLGTLCCGIKNFMLKDNCLIICLKLPRTAAWISLKRALSFALKILMIGSDIYVFLWYVYFLLNFWAR